MEKTGTVQQPFREEILKHLNSLDDTQNEKHPWFMYSLDLVTTQYAALKSDPDYRSSLSDEEVKFLNTDKAVTSRAIGTAMPVDSLLSMSSRDAWMMAWRNNFSGTRWKKIAVLGYLDLSLLRRPRHLAAILRAFPREAEAS